MSCYPINLGKYLCPLINLIRITIIQNRQAATGLTRRAAIGILSDRFQSLNLTRPHP